MLRFRWYTVFCPACRRSIEILPPDSIVAEKHGLAHRCPNCRRWLAIFVLQIGSSRQPEVRLIEGRSEPEDLLQWRQRIFG